MFLKGANFLGGGHVPDGDESIVVTRGEIVSQIRVPADATEFRCARHFLGWIMKIDGVIQHGLIFVQLDLLRDTSDSEMFEITIELDARDDAGLSEVFADEVHRGDRFTSGIFRHCRQIVTEIAQAAVAIARPVVFHGQSK